MSNQDFADFRAPGEKPILDNIFQVSDKFLGQMRLWLEQNPPAVPISSILGFSQFTYQAATPINTLETTASTAYTDLATVGPTITGLPNGTYVCLYGALAANSSTNATIMAIQANSTTPDDSQTAQILGSSLTSIAGHAVLTLSAGSNTLTAKYRVIAGTGTYHYRWLLALRQRNA